MRRVRTLDALLTREAREQRGLLALALVAVPLAVVGLERGLLAGEDLRNELVAGALLPGVASLLAAALAIDAFTRDGDSDAGDSLAHLPVGRAKMILGKGLWLVAASLVIFAWTALAQGLWAFAAGDVPALAAAPYSRGQAWGWGLGTLAILAHGALLGAHLRRPFLAGAAFLLLLAALGLLLHGWREELARLPEVWPREWSLALLLATPIACLTWALGLGRRLPLEGLRVGLASLATCALVLGGLGVAQVRLGEQAGRPCYGQAIAYNGDLAPDGSLLLTYVEQPFERLLGGHDRTFGGFVLDVASGAHLWTIPEGTWPESRGAGPWLAGNRLRMLRDEPGVCDLVDGRTGAVLEAGAALPPRVRPETGEPRRELSPDGAIEFLGRRLVRPGVRGGGRYVELATGRVLAELPEDHAHYEWTGGADPVATAIPVGLRSAEWEAGMRRRLFVGPQGLRPVSLERWGFLRSLPADQGGGFLLYDGARVWRANDTGRCTGLLYGPEGLEGLTR